MPRIESTSSASGPPSADNDAEAASPTTRNKAEPASASVPGQLQNLTRRSRDTAPAGSRTPSFASAQSRLSGATSTNAAANATPQLHERHLSAAQVHEIDTIDQAAEAIAEEISATVIAAEESGASPQSSRTSTPAGSFRTANESPERSASRTSSRRSQDITDADVSRPVSREPSPASSRHSAEIEQQVLTNSHVNDVSHLAKTLPQDIEQCVSSLLSPVRSQFSGAEFDQLVQTQTAVLRSRNINNKDQLISTLRTISRKDGAMTLAQGAVGGLHFNLPGIITSYGLEPQAVHPNNPATTSAVQGMIGGTVAGLSDAIATPARAKTFSNDPYYKRPLPEHLPRELRGLNAQSGSEAIGETIKTFLTGYGASYVARGTIRTATTLTHGPETATAVETAIATPLNVMASTGSAFIQHKIDEHKGRSGIPFFMARQNLGECIDASRKPISGYIGAAVAGAGNHVANVVKQAPLGVKQAVTEPYLLASTGSLAAALSVPFTAAGAVQQKLSDHPKAADLVGALTKYALLEGAWTGWGAAYAGTAHLQSRSAARRAVPGQPDQQV